MAKSMSEMLQQAAAANMVYRTAPETLRRNDAMEAEEQTAKSSAQINFVAPSNTTKKHNRKVQPDMPNGTIKQSFKYKQEVQNLVTPEDVPNFVKEKPSTLTQQQQLVLDHLKAHEPRIAYKAIILDKLNIILYIVHNILIRLTALGMIKRKRSGQGVLLKVIEDACNSAQSTTARCNQMAPLGHSS